jgi:ELWxxDGT repeat protein
VLHLQIEPAGELFFVANDGVHGTELWQSDGTEEGTVLVADISPNSTDIGAWALTAFGGGLFFFGDDGVHGWEPWVILV